jgi:hypothetical protein
LLSGAGLKNFPTPKDCVVMRCFLKPLCPIEKKLEKIVRKLNWRLTCYQIFFYDRIYESVDKWLFETHCDLDELNCIISVYVTMKDLDSGPYTHCLACVSIKYGFDECEDGVYKRSVGYRIEYCDCEHNVSCFLRFNNLYRKIFLYIFDNVCTGFDIVDVEHSSVISCVEMCEQNYSVLVSPRLVYKLFVYFQRLKRAMTQRDMLCYCSEYNICKCGITKQQLGVWY